MYFGAFFASLGALCLYLAHLGLSDYRVQSHDAGLIVGFVGFLLLCAAVMAVTEEASMDSRARGRARGRGRGR